MRSVLAVFGVTFSGLAGLVLVLGTALPQRVDVSAAVVIDAPRAEIWRLASDFEGAFEESNLEHDGTTVLSSPKAPLRDGLRFRQREYVGGLRGVLKAELFDVYPEKRFVWCAEADYTLWGLPLVTIMEGGVFRIEDTREGEGFRVSHYVWGDFPDTLYGDVLSWVSIALLDMEADVERHTVAELEYFEEQLEGPGNS
jgi:hypothetical protein